MGNTIQVSNIEDIYRALTNHLNLTNKVYIIDSPDHKYIIRKDNMSIAEVRITYGEGDRGKVESEEFQAINSSLFNYWNNTFFSVEKYLPIDEMNKYDGNKVVISYIDGKRVVTEDGERMRIYCFNNLSCYRSVELQ